MRRLCAFLLDNGVEAGDRVAILGRTSLDWALLDLATLAIGAVVVPIYPTSSADQIRHIVEDSGSTHFAAESVEDRDRLIAAGARDAWILGNMMNASITADPIVVSRRIAAVRSDHLAMIVYTSGTTGVAKGCTLTHRNMYAAAVNTVLHTGPLFGGDAAQQGVSAIGLPLAHVFGQTILFACLYGGTDTRLLPGIPELIPALEKISPTFLALVPYALEKIRKMVRANLPAEAEQTAVADGLDALGAETTLTAEPLAVLGRRLRHVISGGASLDASTAGFFAGFGVSILNCYGMTETATAATVNRPGTNKLGTVGQPIPGTTVSIADDGEILVRGTNVTAGYWGAASGRSPLDSAGWLLTGDIGSLDDDGFLRVTGRKKEILVTSGGKNVAPTPLEDRLRLHPLVSNAIVVGDGRSFIAALITLNSVTHDANDESIRSVIQSAVDDANTLVSRAESIRAFRVLDEDFTVSNGLLTSSLKLKRSAIEVKFRTEMNSLYASRV